MTQTLSSRDPSDPLFQPVGDSDPATPGDPLSRLRFHYGQCLSAEDFETEQRYFVLRQRLHNALLHGVGTVWGLAIRRRQPRPEGGDQLICEPGMAIDPLGREIWVPQALCLDLAALETSFWLQLQPPPATAGAPTATPMAAPEVAPEAATAPSAAPVESRPGPAQGSEPQPGPTQQPEQPASQAHAQAAASTADRSDPNPAAGSAEASAPPGPAPKAAPAPQAPAPTVRRAYVVLRYEACLTDAVPVIPLPCGDEHEGLAPSRLRDSFRLCLEAEAPPDPYATVRDISQRPMPAEPRQRLLRHALNDPPLPPTLAPLERFWSGADDGALLLATIDLTAEPRSAPEGLQPVSLLPAVAPASNPDNDVRAVLPAVQALADLALAIRLEGRATAPQPFQAVGVAAMALKADGTPVGAGEPAVAMQVEIRLSDRPLLDADPAKGIAALKQAVQLLVWDGTTSAWREVTDSTSPERLTTWEISTETERPAIRLGLQPPWALSTSFQVVLQGTGANALMAASTPLRPLAGVAGELVPAGCGRDAHLFATYTPTT